VLSGDLSKLHEALRKADQERQLEALSSAPKSA
jgi:peptide chain release factor 1